MIALEQFAAEGGKTLERELLSDFPRDRYAVFLIGWQGHRRVHTCLVHIDLVDDKVWIQEDSTEEGIAHRLIAAGIPKSNIVLAFHTPFERELTDLAAG